MVRVVDETTGHKIAGGRYTINGGGAIYVGEDGIMMRVDGAHYALMPNGSPSTRYYCGRRKHSRLATVNYFPCQVGAGFCG